MSQPALRMCSTYGHSTTSATPRGPRCVAACFCDKSMKYSTFFGHDFAWLASVIVYMVLRPRCRSGWQPSSSSGSQTFYEPARHRYGLAVFAKLEPAVATFPIALSTQRIQPRKSGIGIMWSGGIDHQTCVQQCIPARRIGSSHKAQLGWIDSAAVFYAWPSSIRVSTNNNHI